MTRPAPATVDLPADLGADVDAAALALARCVAAGGTVWCLAADLLHDPTGLDDPSAPAAVVIPDPDLLTAARSLVRPRDALLAAGRRDRGTGADVRRVLRRAPAWGAVTVWIGSGWVGSGWVGSGARPPDGAADHVLWHDEPAAVVRRLRDRMRAALTAPVLPLAAAECADDVCVTCSDEGRPGEVLAPGTDGTATVRTARGTETVLTLLVEPVAAGDLLLVHAGTAIARLDDDSDDADSDDDGPDDDGPDRDGPDHPDPDHDRGLR